MYRLGQGVAKDYAEAVRWYRKAADLGGAECGVQRAVGTGLVQRGVVAEVTASNRVTAWVYAQAEVAIALAWARADEMVPLAAKRRIVLR